jgi:hypothetical protein
MKKIFALFAAVLFLFSCDKETSDPIIDTPLAPEAVVKSIAQNFPNAKDIQFTEIITKELWDVDFIENALPNEVIIANDGEIQEWGIKKEGSGFAPLILTDPIIKYLEANYPNYKLIKIYEKFDVKTKELIGYTVYINNGAKELALEFDVNGGFLNVVTVTSPDTPNSNPTKDGESTKWVIKDLASLPANIVSALKSKHPDFTFSSGSGIKIPNYIRYYVTIRVGEKLYSYEFNEKGEIINSSSYDPKEPGSSNGSSSITFTSEIVQGALPKIILDQLNTSYNGWKYIKGLITTNDKKEVLGYNIVVALGNIYYYLTCDGAGKIIKTEKVSVDGSGTGGMTTISLFDEKGNPKGIPAGILSQLDNNYKGWKGVKGFIEYNEKKEIIRYYIIITLNNVDYALTFDAKEKLIKEEKYNTGSSTITQKPYTEASSLPDGIKGYLDKNFVGWQFIKGYAEIDASGKALSHLVVIQLGKDLYYVTFDGKQVFTGAKKG